MKFQARVREEPEINLIPFIDVLLVILIFLMLTTTYSKFTELQLTLPEASADAAKDRPQELVIAVASDGRYAVNKQPLEQQSVGAIAQALRAADPAEDSHLIISADAASAHQSVVTVMDAARRLGLTHITFMAQTDTL